jgi:hypothetical protein
MALEPARGYAVGRWQPARTGELVGTYLLRTGPRSWAHLNAGGCVDSNSLVHIESVADFIIRVRRGQVSAADGKRGEGLPKSWWLR